MTELVEAIVTLIYEPLFGFGLRKINNCPNTALRVILLVLYVPLTIVIGFALCVALLIGLAYVFILIGRASR